MPGAHLGDDVAECPHDVDDGHAARAAGHTRPAGGAGPGVFALEVHHSQLSLVNQLAGGETLNQVPGASAGTQPTLIALLEGFAACQGYGINGVPEWSYGHSEVFSLLPLCCMGETTSLVDGDLHVTTAEIFIATYLAGVNSQPQGKCFTLPPS
jgi:hypothetical protein